MHSTAGSRNSSAGIDQTLGTFVCPCRDVMGVKLAMINTWAGVESLSVPLRDTLTAQLAIAYTTDGSTGTSLRGLRRSNRV